MLSSRIKGCLRYLIAHCNADVFHHLRSLPRGCKTRPVSYSLLQLVFSSLQLQRFMSKKNLSWLGKKFGLKVTDGIIKNKCSVVKSNEMAGVSKRRANSCFA